MRLKLLLLRSAGLGSLWWEGKMGQQRTAFYAFTRWSFFAPAPKMKEWESHLLPELVCYNPCLQSSLLQFHIVQYNNSCSAALQSLSALLAVTGSDDMIQTANAQPGLDCFAMFMFGFKANRYWLHSPCCICTLCIQQALPWLPLGGICVNSLLLTCQSASCSRCMLVTKGREVDTSQRKGNSAHLCKMN